MPKAVTLMQVGDLELALKRSARRRSIGLKVAAGQASVSAPKTASLNEIHFFVASKLDWIKKHLTQQQLKLQQQPVAEQLFAAGATIDYLGQKLTLDILAATPIAGHILEQSVQLHLPVHLHKPSAIRQLIRHVYSRAAYQYICDKIDHYGPLLGVTPKSIAIKEYKSRWGSCNSRRELQFNWLIMLAPREAVNYIVAHELCHLVHFNHSPKFWASVKKLVPDYQKWRKWFRENGTQLHL